MSDATGIEWADATWSPVVGCSPVSPGCLNCYAASMARRLQGMGKPGYKCRMVHTDCGDEAVEIAEIHNGRAVFTGDVRLLPERLGEPMRWRKPRRIFVCSMSDLFHGAVPFEFIDRVFLVAAVCPEHRFLILTKRPERMAEYAADPGRLTRIASAMAAAGHGEESMSLRWPLPNVWLGTSCEDQQRANERIPHLLRCPAAVRFLSCEPLLGPIDLHDLLGRWHCDYCDALYAEYSNGCLRCHFGETGTATSVRLMRISWVIVGGESGPKARPCDIGWIRSLVGQCQAASVPVFVKQVGAVAFSDECHPSMVRVNPKSRRWPTSDRKGGDPSEWPEDLRVREMPEECANA